MAYAALSSLMHTLQQLPKTNPCLVSSGSNKKQLNSIYQSLCAIQALLEEAKVMETLKVLEKRIRDVVYKSEDRVDSSLRSIILDDNEDDDDGGERARIAFNEELKVVEKEVDSLKKEVMQIEFNNHETKSAELATSSSSRRYTIEQNTVVGMEDDFNTILDRLTAQTHELTVIPVVGMGGIGKTTLARKAYDDSSIRYRFDTHAWVTISETYNERQVLLDVVSSIIPNRTDESNMKMSNDQLAEIVYRGLKCRRFLIVIDDLWSTEAWDHMRRMFPNDDNRSRILLTTRLKYVADYASCPEYPPHNMSFLSFDDSWNLFNERLFQEQTYPPKLEEIGKHIVQQCRGLPLSIVVIAGILGKMDRTYDNWKKVEENLNSFFGTVSEQCQSILSLSYSYLPQYLKACFLYVGGFPEDMEISVSKLIKLWIAELFVRARSNKRLEMVAEEYLEELIDRSLILAGTRRANGRMKTCKIHDLLRQLCIREAQTENVMLVMNENVPIFLQDVDYQRRVIISLGKHVYLPRQGNGVTVTSRARSLVLTSFCGKVSVQRPCYFVSHFKLLKVLDVLKTHHNFCSVIPELVHLRYVAAKIDEAPSLAKLWNLHTIILFRSEMTALQLPLEIWTMSEIRHIDISRYIHMPNPLDAESHNSIEEQKPLFLNNLQTLSLHSSPFVAEILTRTPNLNKLKITSESTSHWSAIVDSLISLKGLETLQIAAAPASYPISLSRDIFLPNLKKLRLYFTYFPWEDMVMLANLPNLEVLKAHNGFMGTDWKLNKDVVFQRLKYLQIVFGYKLERWEAGSDNFPMLEQLFLYGLHLEEIPQGIGDIPTLKLIQIENCSSTAVTSAKKIQEEQESWGNYELQVQIIQSQK